MSVRIYIPDDQVHKRVLEAFYYGCPLKREMVPVYDYKPSDVAVVFGIYKSKVPQSFARGKVIAGQLAKGLGVVVLETGYIHRGDGPKDYYAAGFDGLNGRANFRNEGMQWDRFKELKVELKPWMSGGKIILCGQVPWDASVDHIDFPRWVLQARDEIKARTDRPIVFRPHPKARMPEVSGCEYSTRPLVEDLADAFACVTFNSNSAVEALLEGVPVFAFDKGSMALGVSNRSWDDLHNPKTPERMQWAADLAYTQWTLEEMAEGKTWKHLFRSPSPICPETSESTSTQLLTQGG